MNQQWKHKDWTIYFDPTPLPDRQWDYVAVHEDYDGPGDDRIIYAESTREAEDLIEDWYLMLDI